MIAISYRREDSLPTVGRLYDRLQAKFGKENVFMDFDSIPPGVDFREQIRQMIERSNVVIAIIGPDWLGEQPDAPRRIDNPIDFVRVEIAYALTRGIPIIPVLVDNTPMPSSEKLPEEIKDLAFRNAVTLDTGIDFHHHVDRLIEGIRKKIRKSSRIAVHTRSLRKIFILSAAILLAVAASATWLLRGHFRQGHSSNAAVSTPVPSPGSTATPILSEFSARVHFDSQTGLMWTIRDNGTDVTWWQANEYAQQLHLGGYADWRLPTIEELEELHEPQIGIRKPFKVHGLMWSSTKSGADHALFFNFWAGLRGSLPLDATDQTRAICVRRAWE